MHRGNGAGYPNSQESAGAFSDMDTFVDFDMFPFSSGSNSQNSSSTNLSRTASNQPTIQPSFPYDLYQQTVPPVVSSDFHMPELTSGASSSITMSPDLLDMDEQLNAMMPPFFFPEASGGTVDPATILGASTVAPDMGVEYKYIPQPAPQFDGKRLYAGIHTQRAAYNKDLENQRRMMEQAKKNTSTPPSTQTELTLDQRIDAVLSKMKPPKVVPSITSPSQALPHIARMRKDEEEMDEDERLLASEEGKKLSSKERRQLRNKVSARAFRSRRKEYIGQLEAEVAGKTTEAAELRAENATLKSEIQQLQEFTRSVLRSPAFSSFLADLEKGQAAALAPPAPTPAPVPEPQPNYHKDPNPNSLNLVNDDWALAYGPVAGAPMWATNTQVYAVTELPKGPVNLQDLSGKATKIRTEDFIDWSAFPPPADGFSPNYSEKSKLAPVAEEEDYEMYDAPEEESAYIMPDNLEDLVAAKEGKISDRIEKLAPGVGLDSLLGRLEAVITGEVDVKEAFAGVAEEAVNKQVEGQEDEVVEENSAEYRQRCRDVARMFDVMESYNRVGAIVGRS